ncbi:MAG: T9SS type A sorting domain-containing protein, partial [Bacteroidota bacterium]
FVLAIDEQDYLYIVDDGALVRSTRPVTVSAEGQPTTAQLALSIAPNPARLNAVLSLTVPIAQHVRIDVVDQLGRLVTTVHNGALAAGRHSLHVDTGLPAGAYVARANGGGEVITKRFTVIR